VLRVIAADRAAGAPQATALEALLADAESAEATARSGWRRGPRERATIAWHRAVTEAARRSRELRLDRARRRDEVHALLATAAAEVTAAGSRSAAGGRRAAGAAAGARVLLAAAAGYAAAGDLDRAEDAAQDALALADVALEPWRRQRERLEDPALRALWSRQVAATVDESRRTGGAAVVIDKARRRLTVYRAGREVARFPAELGTSGLVRKRFEGDAATPEGRYQVVEVRTGPATRYHVALLLDYPNADDRRRFDLARRAGEIPAGAGIGGLIEIHGHGGRGRDWTEGCVALADRDMDDLLEWVGRGTPVTIVATAVPR